MTMNRTWTGAGVPFAAVLAAGVYAAALSPAAAAPPVSNGWSGYYVGAVGSYGWGQTTAAFAYPSFILNWAALDMNTSGGLIGATLGYNYDLHNNWVLGAEGDISWGNIAGTGFMAATTGLTRGDPGYNPNDTDGKFHQSYFATVRARLGYSTGAPTSPTLWYLTGGFAFSDGHREIMNTTVGDSLASQSQAGLVVGAGVEHKFASHWSVKGEVLYADLGTGYYQSSTSSVVTAVHLSDTLLRVGLNYGF